MPIEATRQVLPGGEFETMATTPTLMPEKRIRCEPICETLQTKGDGEADPHCLQMTADRISAPGTGTISVVETGSPRRCDHGNMRTSPNGSATSIMVRVFGEWNFEANGVYTNNSGDAVLATHWTGLEFVSGQKCVPRHTLDRDPDVALERL
ncbi:hypothetical protein R3X27_13745 [Tropicimonas sp. TH_r6]|uniref:hypothetical protein n=1 Tax=Tropicimonas sp. TH_r6 TaxID=3082085 RepID=UPI002954F173|nr:hypothetical protein [Tropicimonas sp. TH_r6]MDV7143745.1 hypothetical protein [Tropicimonas sp. TH_r6]